MLLIAPTGGGKTLAGFLPSLVELSGAESTSRSSPLARSAPSPLVGEGGGRGSRGDAHASTLAPNLPTPTPVPSPQGGGEKTSRLISTGRDIRREGGLHTLYISPLKALAVDIARNLETPIAEMGLPIRIETRTGDTPTSKRQRQRRDPPEILLTTPEQLALLLASADAPYLFGSLKRVILDELHALVTSKRGDLLSLGLARLFRLAPDLTSIGLSATVAEPDDLCRFMVPQRGGPTRAPISIVAEGGAAPDVAMLDTSERLPWAGHSARYALGEALCAHQGAPHHAGFRQHPQPGRRHLSGPLAHQRRQSRHRAASRLARRGAAAQGRSSDDDRPPARGGVHVVARSRRRLGRRRSRHQCRRAEGRVAHAAAHRPRQSPHGRAVQGRAGAGQPLRGAGMPRRARCHRRECAGHAGARASARSTCWRSMCSAAPAARRS